MAVFQRQKAGDLWETNGIVKMHIPYQEKLKHKVDFRVKYKFYSEAEGGRKSLPYQGIRFDFWYEHEDAKENSVYIIWPEFEDEKQNVILDNTKSVPESGTARMWIIMDKMRKYHRDRIKVGIIGFFFEGKKVGRCEVIEIIGLLENPIE